MLNLDGEDNSHSILVLLLACCQLMLNLQGEGNSCCILVLACCQQVLGIVTSIMIMSGSSILLVVYQNKDWLALYQDHMT